MPSKPKLTAQEMLQAAKRYLEQTEAYEAATQKGLAEFLGVSVNILHQRLPQIEWKQLQSSWFQNKINQTIELLRTKSKDGEPIAIEDVARYAKLPLAIVRRFLPENEQPANQSRSSITQEHNAAESQLSLDTQYMLQAKEYLESTDQYKKTTVRHFAKFLGKAEKTIYTHIPAYKWEILRNDWIEKRLKQAMDAVYAEAKIQQDFNHGKIAEYAQMPFSTVQRFLPLDEWRTRRDTLPTIRENREALSREYLRQAEIYFTRTDNYRDLTREKFADYLGISKYIILGKLPYDQWETLVHEWVMSRIKRIVADEGSDKHKVSISSIVRHTKIPFDVVRYYFYQIIETEQDHSILAQLRLKNAYEVPLEQLRWIMDKVYAESKTQEDFTLTKVADLAGISRFKLTTRLQNEWQARKETLPTTQEKVLAAIQQLVDANTPKSEFTRQRIIEVADVNGSGQWSWFTQAYFNALHQLALHSHKEITDPPAGLNTRKIPGGWINLDSDIWDLRPAGKRLLMREKLREDFAEIGWPILQRELLSPEISLGTVCGHYDGFRKGSSMLGDDVPDIRRATLETTQRAWMKFNGTHGLRTKVRVSLALIFETLMRLAEQENAIDGKEMLRIFTWLRDDITVGRTSLGEDFLSEKELDAVIEGCLIDIAAGIAYTDTGPDFLSVNLRPGARENANAVVFWSTALMILIMAFTGLRRESILDIKIDDWMEIHKDLYVLAWHHNKKVEENAAVLPAALAQHIQLYVQRTNQIRSAIKTNLVLLCNNLQGHWHVWTGSQFHFKLKDFVKRHNLEREGVPLPLNSTVLRRTYTTRALYEGKNPAAVRAELGHIHLDSTFRYLKFDRYEHSAEVGMALDEYGRKALVLWRAPLLLDELDPEERKSLLDRKDKQRQDVGICRHDHCIKVSRGNLPPCSLCEHLVTGSEFLEAWRTEHHQRRKEIRLLATEPGAEMMLAQMNYQFRQFEKNFAFIQEKVH